MPLNQENLFHVDAYAEMFVDSLLKDSVDETLADFLEVARFCNNVMHAYWAHLQAEETPPCCAELKELFAHPQRFSILRLQPGEFNLFRLHLISQVLKHLVEKLPMPELHNAESFYRFRQLTQLSSQSLLTALQRYEPSAPSSRPPSRRTSYVFKLFAAATVGSLTGLLGFWLRQMIKISHSQHTEPYNPISPPESYSAALLLLVFGLALASTCRLITTPQPQRTPSVRH